MSNEAASGAVAGPAGTALSFEESTRRLTAIVEQLLVDNKRDRDTEAAVMNMQFGRLRFGPAANAAIIAGAGADLRTWQQP